MPKQGKCPRRRIEVLMKQFEGESLTTDGVVLTCKLCEKVVNSEKKYFVQQHLNSNSHRERKQRSAKENQNICLLSNFVKLSNKESSFHMDLCQMLVESNIPLYKVQDSSFRTFMQKYCKIPTPDHTKLRKTYLKKLYDATVQRIREAVGEKRIWVSVDETTDVKGQYVVNTIVGALSPEEPSTPWLIGSEIVERTNHASIAQAFCNSLSLLWPGGIKHDKVLLFVSDAAPYMKKAGAGLKVLFPKMIHLTCLAHAIHRVCEEIRVSFPEVDCLIANVKKVFLKAPSRVRVFRESAPDVALPPEPIVTRWGTWISAAMYYAANLEDIKRVLEQLDGNEAAAIGKSQDLVSDPVLKCRLTFIASNFATLPDSITKLESTKQLLGTTIRVVEELRQHIDSAKGPIATSIQNKFQRVIRLNAGYDVLRKIQDTLQGGTLHAELSEYSASELLDFKYAPIASVDVERSFSRYKALLSDRRYSLTPENLKYHIIPMCNAFVTE
ncbi:uncharacterized protein LOC100899883 [Galendromus occidentalis]|uniref:Uncharacterized protein LOC100899883 n=1 Tax=Galendromus occidentalis TaxID=34638 RepID=A0AAJ6VWU0_9ACAR|nr:uncharacterized protein LOC100899883 [Galendromus occidentalis]